MRGNLNAIIVDDEQRHHDTLGKMLQNFCPEVHVLRHAHCVKETLELIDKFDPNLIFLDIEMPSGNGCTLLDAFEKAPFEVIFTAVYDFYAINAIKYAALDYLMEPINIQELKDAVVRAKKAILKQDGEGTPKMAPKVPKSSIFPLSTILFSSAE